MNINALLTLIWWIWGIVLILLLVVLSSIALFKPDEVRAAWEWFVPNLFPTMALVGGIQYQQAKTKAKAPAAKAKPNPAPLAPGARPQSWVTLALSLLYLALLSGALLGTLWAPDPLGSLRMSNLWLGPILALNSAAIGVLFVKA
ncbi:hypothetical protein P1X14_11525 [Sphingomonas sp. AOB5]|uniref:hypothetical protein n=1 Tax=Sphingomonas sp. AOB5 TaxID=3034017 RepID=UPI0023F7A267|nr:hypothetical protein [Sphingomonas sp. AOB5]MDF7775878.1 hypothetical protein [Sphingomonas sp. AOB5]